jgi:hypothetical protein
MRFAALVLFAFAGIAAAQVPVPPTETAPTGSVTVSRTASSTSTSRTRSSSGTRSGTGTLSGTLTASTNGTMTATASSVTPTTTTYPTLGDASPCGAYFSCFVSACHSHLAQSSTACKDRLRKPTAQPLLRLTVTAPGSSPLSSVIATPELTAFHSPLFRSSLVQCVAANCPSDLTSAEQLGQVNTIPRLAPYISQS